MNKSIILILISGIFLFSCKTNKSFLTVENIKNIDNYQVNPLIYTLPKTVIAIDVEISKQVFKKGPFSEYAEQFLGIADVIEEDNIKWSITSIDIQSYAKVDTNHIYIINSPFQNNSNLINLSKEGFLLSINKPVGTYYSDIESDDNMVIDNNIDASLSYGEIMVKKNYKEIYDTTYNEIADDTSFVRVPVIKTQLVEKTIADQAEELAEQILTLRDDRGALLVGEGDSEYLPDGTSLQTMLDGLDNLEDEYLSMFTGKTFTTKQIYNFEYIPEEKTAFRQISLFRFSETDGLLETKNIKGKPVYLEITSENYTELIDEFAENQALLKRIEKIKEKNTGLVYRLPEKIKVKLVYKNSDLFSTEMLIAQYGSIMRIPVNIFTDSKYSIEFYPKYGSIKSIEIVD